MKTISFLGFNVVYSSLAEFVHFLPSILKKSSFLRLVTLNPEIVMKAEDQNLSEWIKQADYIQVPVLGTQMDMFNSMQMHLAISQKHTVFMVILHGLE